MKKIYLLAALILMPFAVQARLRVVTTLPVFADLVRQVGGERVEVRALSSGKKDPHHLTALPSFALLLARADVFVEAGLDLEKGWTAPLLKESGNRAIQPGQRGYVPAAAGIRLLEVPGAGADRSWGDIHVQGNPHYWNDPVNGIIIARNIRDTLSRLDPGHKTYYEGRYSAFSARIRSLTIAWLRKLQPFFGTKIVVHHREWVYLAARFRLQELAGIEEKLGIEPGMGYMERLLRMVRDQRPKLILIAFHNPDRYARYLSERTGVPWLRLPNDLGVVNGVDGYERLIAHTLEQLYKVLSR